MWPLFCCGVLCVARASVDCRVVLCGMVVGVCVLAGVMPVLLCWCVVHRGVLVGVFCVGDGVVGVAVVPGDCLLGWLWDGDLFGTIAGWCVVVLTWWFGCGGGVGCLSRLGWWCEVWFGLGDVARFVLLGLLLALALASGEFAECLEEQVFVEWCRFASKGHQVA